MTGLGAVALAAALAAWLVLSVEAGLRSWSALLGVPAVVLLAAGIALRRPAAIPGSLALLGATYALRLLTGPNTLDGDAPVVAAALFALAEVAYWSLELRDGVADESGSHLRRIGLLASFAVGVVVIGVALLALVEAVGTTGLALEALGAAAAVAAFALLRLASRPRL